MSSSRNTKKDVKDVKDTQNPTENKTVPNAQKKQRVDSPRPDKAKVEPKFSNNPLTTNPKQNNIVVNKNTKVSNKNQMTRRQLYAYTKWKSPKSKSYEQLIDTSSKELKFEMVKTIIKNTRLNIGEPGSFETWCVRYMRDYRTFLELKKKLKDRSDIDGIQKRAIVDDMDEVINKKRTIFEKLFNDFLWGNPIIHPETKVPWTNTDNTHRGEILKYLLRSEYLSKKTAHFFIKITSDIMEKYTASLSQPIPTKKPKLDDTLIKNNLGFRSFSNLNYLINVALGSYNPSEVENNIYNDEFVVPVITINTKPSTNLGRMVLITRSNRRNAYRLGDTKLIDSKKNEFIIGYKPETLVINKDDENYQNYFNVMKRNVRELNNLVVGKFEVYHIFNTLKRSGYAKENIEPINHYGLVYFSIKKNTGENTIFFLPFHHLSNLIKKAKVNSDHIRIDNSSKFYCGIITSSVAISFDNLWASNDIMIRKRSIKINHNDFAFLDYISKINSSPFKLLDFIEMIEIQKLIRHILETRVNSKNNTITIDLFDKKIENLLNFRFIGISKINVSKTKEYINNFFKTNRVVNKTRDEVSKNYDLIDASINNNITTFPLFDKLSYNKKRPYTKKTKNLEEFDIFILFHKIALKLAYAANMNIYGWLNILKINWQYGSKNITDKLNISNTTRVNKDQNNSDEMSDQ